MALDLMEFILGRAHLAPGQENSSTTLNEVAGPTRNLGKRREKKNVSDH